MSWFGKKRPFRPPGKVVAIKGGSVDTPRESTSSVSSSEALLESETEGAFNPLAWESVAPALRERFPHWEHSSPALRHSSSAGKTESSCEHPFHQFSSSSVKQPQNTIPYVVMDCDTLNSISVKFDTTPGEIARLNRKTVAGTVFSGEVLYVPDQDVVIPSSPPTSDDGNLIGQLNESQENEKPAKSDQTPPPSSSPSSPTTPPPAQSDVVSDRETILLDWQAGTLEEVADTHVRVVAKFMSDDQGCVHGSLMVTKVAIMFRPHAHDPLVREHGCHGEFEVVIPLQDVTYACISKDCCSCKIESKRKSVSQSEAPPSNRDDRMEHPHAEPADNSGNEATPVAKETSNPSSGDDHMTNEVGGASESSVAKETTNPSSEDNHMTNDVVESSKSTPEKLTNRNAESTEASEQNQSLQSSNATEAEGESGVEPNVTASKPPLLTNSVEQDSNVAQNHISSAEGSNATDTVPAISTAQKGAGPVTQQGAGSETQQGAEFPISSSNRGNTNQEEDELLDGMMAAGATTSTPSSRPSHSDSNSSDNSEASSSASLFVEHPNFLHVRVAPQPGSAYTYIPLSNVGIAIPDNESSKRKKKNKSRVRTNSAPIQHVKNLFCFAIPERRVEDLVGFMCRHHPQAISSNTSPAESKESSFEFITCSQGLDGEELKFHDEHFTDPDASSWEIYSLKDIPKYRNLIPRMEVEATLPLPNMSDISELLKEEHIRKLCSKLPYQAVGHDWVLIYSTCKHGISLRTLYRNMAGYEETPVLLVVRDQNKKLFGAVVSCRLLISDHFYGTGESLLYTFSDSAELTVFPWTGANHYIVKGNSDSIGIGSGDGHFGLWLDEYFYHGSSYRCSTFENDCLATTEDFLCEAVEAWGFSEMDD